MNDTALKSLEELFYQKIMLYNDLLNCFKEERESLVNIDMEKTLGDIQGKGRIKPKNKLYQTGNTITFRVRYRFKIIQRSPHF